MTHTAPQIDQIYEQIDEIYEDSTEGGTVATDISMSGLPFDVFLVEASADGTL